MHDGTPPMPGRIGRDRLSMTLLALAIGYALLVIGPLWNTRAAFAHWLTDLAPDAPRFPAGLTVGVALLGAAALVYIVARQVRDVELHPYASIAPVLAVFSGIVLSGLRVQLPFPGLSGAELGLAGLSLALTGGALAGRPEPSARALGWALAAAPTLALICALSATRGDGDPLAMLRAADPLLRAYLVLLAVSSLALALIAHVLGGQALGLAAAAHNQRSELWPTMRAEDLRHESPAAFAAAYVPGSYALHGRPPLALHEQLRALAQKRPPARVLGLAAGVLGLFALAGCLLVMKSDRDRLADERAQQAQLRREQAALVERAFAEELSATPVPVLAPTVTPLAPVQPNETAASARVEAEPRTHGRHHHRHRAQDPTRREPKHDAKPALAKATPKTSHELDFDELMRQALPGGGKNNGADDPLLGL
jgi:hypothetical protein